MEQDVLVRYYAGIRVETELPQEVGGVGACCSRRFFYTRILFGGNGDADFPAFGCILLPGLFVCFSVLSFCQSNFLRAAVYGAGLFEEQHELFAWLIRHYNSGTESKGAFEVGSGVGFLN